MYWKVSTHVLLLPSQAYNVKAQAPVRGKTKCKVYGKNLSKQTVLTKLFKSQFD